MTNVSYIGRVYYVEGKKKEQEELKAQLDEKKKIRK